MKSAQLKASRNSTGKPGETVNMKKLHNSQFIKVRLIDNIYTPFLHELIKNIKVWEPVLKEQKIKLFPSRLLPQYFYAMLGSKIS